MILLPNNTKQLHVKLKFTAFSIIYTKCIVNMISLGCNTKQSQSLMFNTIYIKILNFNTQISRQLHAKSKFTAFPSIVIFRSIDSATKQLHVNLKFTAFSIIYTKCIVIPRRSTQYLAHKNTNFLTLK